MPETRQAVWTHSVNTSSAPHGYALRAYRNARGERQSKSRHFRIKIILIMNKNPKKPIVTAEGAECGLNPHI